MKTSKLARTGLGFAALASICVLGLTGCQNATRPVPSIPAKTSQLQVGSSAHWASVAQEMIEDLKVLPATSSVAVKASNAKSSFDQVFKDEVLVALASKQVRIDKTSNQVIRVKSTLLSLRAPSTRNDTRELVISLDFVDKGEVLQTVTRHVYVHVQDEGLYTLANAGSADAFTFNSADVTGWAKSAKRLAEQVGATGLESVYLMDPKPLTPLTHSYRNLIESELFKVGVKVERDVTSGNLIELDVQTVTDDKKAITVTLKDEDETTTLRSNEDQKNKRVTTLVREGRWVESEQTASVVAHARVTQGDQLVASFTHWGVVPAASYLAQTR